MKLRTLALYLAVALIWGSSWIPNQQIGDRAEPLAAGALRFAIAALPLLLFVRIPSGAALRHAGVLGLTMLALPYVLLVWSGRHGAANWTPLVYAALPLVVAGSAWRPAMVIALGATFVVLNGALPLAVHSIVWTAPILLAVGLQGFALLYARRHPPDPFQLCLQLLIASALLGALSRATEAAPRIASWGSWTTADLLALAAFSLIGTALAYLLYYRLLAAVEPTQAASTQWLQLVVAVAESAVILGHHPPPAMLCGLLILSACCARVLLAPNREEVTIRLTPPP